MPIDSQIPLAFRPPQIESPLAQYGQMVQLYNLMQQQKMSQQKLAQQEEFRKAMASAKTPEEQVAVARQYTTDPKDVLHYAGQSLDARARMDAARLQAEEGRKQRLHEIELRGQQEIERVREAARERRITQEEADRREAATRESMIRLTASLRPPPQPQAPVAVEDPNNPGKSIFVPPGTAYGMRPFKEPPVRAIPAPVAKQLQETAEIADATQRFSSTFKDNYGGKTFTGDLGNKVGLMFGDDTGQAQWWQDYELHQSQVRNKLFGSALTAPEIEAWNKSAINPRMNSGEIKKNLGRRQKLEQTGLERMMKGVAAGGYSKEQIEAFTGRPVAGSTTTATPQADPLGIR